MKIETLQGIVKILEEFTTSEEGFATVRDVLISYQCEDWKKHMVINPCHYFRKKIFENNNYEVYIITWDIGQTAKIHDHAENGCFLKILQGELTEIIYNKEITNKTISKLNEGDVSFMSNNIGYHSILNTGQIPAVSIHIYSPPNHRIKYYF